MNGPAFAGVAGDCLAHPVLPSGFTVGAFKNLINAVSGLVQIGQSVVSDLALYRD